MHSVTVLRLVSGNWSSGIDQLDRCFQNPNDPKFQYLLTHQDPFSTGQQLSQELSQHFELPQYLLSDVYRRSNGFFASKESLDKNGDPQSCHMWFHVLVKSVSSDSDSSYKWHEMTFCFCWDRGGCSILCIGVDLSFQTLLQETLHREWPRLLPSEPCCMLVPLVETVIALNDRSVWSIRDVIREAEKDRLRPAVRLDNFVRLHEAARHAIHSYETLSVTVETVKALQQQILELSTKRATRDSGATDALYRIKKRMECQMRMLQNLLLRSQSNKERLQNEITFAHNMIAQRDSQAMKGLGQAARQDSRALRTIAVVTMALLPPTFLSAIFSMSFFDYTPGQGSQSAQWSVSKSFWIYWAFAIPLTGLTLGIWFWRQRQIGHTSV